MSAAEIVNEVTPNPPPKPPGPKNSGSTISTNIHKTFKQNRLALSELDELIKCYKPEDRRERHESKRIDRWKSFTYDELIARDKTNLDILLAQRRIPGRHRKPSSSYRGLMRTATRTLAS